MYKLRTKRQVPEKLQVGYNMRFLRHAGFREEALKNCPSTVKDTKTTLTFLGRVNYIVPECPPIIKDRIQCKNLDSETAAALNMGEGYIMLIVEQIPGAGDYSMMAGQVWLLNKVWHKPTNIINRSPGAVFTDHDQQIVRQCVKPGSTFEFTFPDAIAYLIGDNVAEWDCNQSMMTVLKKELKSDFYTKYFSVQTGIKSEFSTIVARCEPDIFVSTLARLIGYVDAGIHELLGSKNVTEYFRANLLDVKPFILCAILTRIPQWRSCPLWSNLVESEYKFVAMFPKGNMKETQDWYRFVLTATNTGTQYNGRRDLFAMFESLTIHPRQIEAFCEEVKIAGEKMDTGFGMLNPVSFVVKKIAGMIAPKPKGFGALTSEEKSLHDDMMSTI